MPFLFLDKHNMASTSFLQSEFTINLMLKLVIASYYSWRIKNINNYPQLNLNVPFNYKILIIFSVYLTIMLIFYCFLNFFQNRRKVSLLSVVESALIIALLFRFTILIGKFLLNLLKRIVYFKRVMGVSLRSFSAV